MKVTEEDLEEYYEHFARVCFGYICEWFPCSLHVVAPPDPPRRHLPNYIDLESFIRGIFVRNMLRPEAIFAALCILERVRRTVASLDATRGEHLFVAALVLADDILYEEQALHSVFWAEATQFVIPLEVIDKCAPDLLRLLQWKVDFPPEMVPSFKRAICWPEDVVMKGERFKEAMAARNGGMPRARRPKPVVSRDCKPNRRSLPNGKPIPSVCLTTAAFAPWAEPRKRGSYEESGPPL